jgi:hypothetical protein
MSTNVPRSAWLAILAVGTGIAVGGAAHAASVDTIYQFTGGADGANPSIGLVAGPNDALYGANADTVFELQLSGKNKWTVTPIYATPDGPPNSIASDGASLYLAMGLEYGQSCPQDDYHCGEILQLTPGQSGWTTTAIYQFAGGRDGVNPTGLAVAKGGAIYGTTDAGGNSANCGESNNVPYGCGTLFSLKQSKSGSWSEKVLLRYDARNGSGPQTDPSIDSAGNVYVTTYLGGGSKSRASHPPGGCDGYDGEGSVSEWGAVGFDELYRQACDDVQASFLAAVLLRLGQTPNDASGSGAIISGEGGGNPNDCTDLGNLGCGVIALLASGKKAKGAWTYTSLHDFTGPPGDGSWPEGYMLSVGKSAVYGLTRLGGTGAQGACDPDGCGTIYELTNGGSGWNWNGTAYNFPGGSGGFWPVPRLTNYKGNILGMTSDGGSGCGSYGCGTIYVFKP